MFFSFGSGLFRKRLSSHSSAVADHGSNSLPDRTFIRRPIHCFKSFFLSFYSPDVAAGEMKSTADASFIRRPTNRPSPELSVSLVACLGPASRPPLRVAEYSILRSTPLRRSICLVACVATRPFLTHLRHCGSWSLLPSGAEALSHPIRVSLDYRFTYLLLSRAYAFPLTWMNQASSLWMYHYN